MIARTKEHKQYSGSFYYWAGFTPHGFANVELDEVLLDHIHLFFTMEELPPTNSGYESRPLKLQGGESTARSGLTPRGKNEATETMQSDSFWKPARKKQRVEPRLQNGKFCSENSIFN